MDNTIQTTIPGRFLVRGRQRNVTNDRLAPLLISDTPISFWGGIDPITGIIIDQQHPLYQECISNVILCIPSGRGSCTTSQVLLELILNRIAPRAIVVRDMDALLCIGAIIAQEFFPSSSHSVCDILHIGSDNFIQLLNFSSDTCESHSEGSRRSSSLYGRISENGEFQMHALYNDDESKILLGADDLAPQLDATLNGTGEASLSVEEQSHYDQCATDAERMALRVIFRYAQLSWNVMDRNHDKLRYLPIQQAHIDGCTFIGPGGLEFVQRLRDAGGRVKVPTTLNSVSTDRRYWKKYQVPEENALNAIALGDGYLALGCSPSFTCAPYLLTSSLTPKLGQDIAWGESNAVVFANSVLGARTEKYADYLDICCAIAGIVPAIGVHSTEKRCPTIILDGTQAFQELHRMSESLDLDLLFPTLGHLCGSMSDGRVPIVLGLEDWNVSTDHLKAFCAAFGTTGASPLIHIAGITPEAKDAASIQSYIASCAYETRLITIQDLYRTFQTLDSSAVLPDNSIGILGDSVNETVNLVALGNPHLSISECSAISKLIQETKIDGSNVGTANTRVIACLSRHVYSEANAKDIDTMVQFGIEFVFDTCWCMLLNEPIIPTDPNAVILTNSGKYAHYGPGLTKRRFRYGSMLDCIRAARTGWYPRRMPRSESVTATFNASASPAAMTTRRLSDPYASFLWRPQHRWYSSMSRSRVSSIKFFPRRISVPTTLSFLLRRCCR
jgi:cis-L-3-hydroxyproline dehydratase